MEERDGRAAILAAARSWIGTKFHDGARLKGIGVDCAQFVAAVYSESCVTSPIPTPTYSPQYFLHTDEERLAEFVKRYGEQIDEAKAEAGDLALYHVGRSYAHAAIIVTWPDRKSARIIHAHKRAGRVLEMGAFDTDLWGRKVIFFSLWP